MSGPKATEADCANSDPRQDQTKTDATIIAPVAIDDNKALESLKTRARHADFTLHELADGSMLLSRWGLSKPLPDAFAVRRFLDQVTGVRR